MKKLKLFLGLVFVIFIALLIYQNRKFFFAEHALTFSLGVETWHWTAPSTHILIYMGACLLIGLIFSALILFPLQTKSKQTIKILNGENTAHLEEIDSLKKEIEKYEAAPDPEPDVESSDAHYMEPDIIEMPYQEKGGEA